MGRLNSLLTSQVVWMSHHDKLSKLPDGFVTIATTPNSQFAGIAHIDKQLFGEYTGHLSLIFTLTLA